jgi:chemotaxis protein MotB
MARKKKHGGHENLERWLVSYADFITLMFAFFVVMFASSQTDKAKAQQVAQSVQKALEEGQVTAVVAKMIAAAQGKQKPGDAALPARAAPPASAKDGARGTQPIADLLPSLEYLEKVLKKEIEAGKMQLRLEPRGLVVSLREAAFFPSGEAVIATAMYPSIEKVAIAIRSLPNPVRLEGHTDSVPIHNSRFQNNWELSAARGVAMLELLTTRYSVPPAQLSIAGYADNSPVADNATEEGRARNRRVDIVILSESGYALEAGAASKPAVTEPREGVSAAGAPPAKRR